MIDSMRSLHGAYAPTDEPFGTRLETFFVGFCVALGDIEGKPFSANKIAAYLHMPRTTVRRRLKRLEGWDIVYCHAHRYHIREYEPEFTHGNNAQLSADTPHAW